jgi:cytochrome c oxidase assembly factor CtaG
MRTIALTSAAFWLGASQAWAHGADAQQEGAVWTFDLWIIAPLLVLGTLYAIGSLVMRRRSLRQPRRSWQVAAFWLGWLTLAGALTSPLHWLGEHLFTFHMIEHEILMAVSAPLLVVANPVGSILWGLPHRGRLIVGRAMRLPAVTASWRWLSDGGHATLLHGIAIWVWHAPLAFDAAVTSVALHRAQHLSFFLTAVLFWWSVLRRSESGAGAWHVFITMLHTSVLGALMALAPRVLFGAQTATAWKWGLTPLEDQQLAGIIMWIPAGTIYAGAALALLAIWIRQASEHTGQQDATHSI